ncbi:hypothetical protein QTJ16_001156 [Diplocarpon rosae]|uniref:F-box domain-containing protein n=1 Tax=Diplocarpon rosae TaxID=946125 RepID=A0AAD9T682_9HELO|nr:hypothetical protein QTJ16_001156 [Diplocarpon rosae]PBP28914.1 WD domain-containing protein [Diplocarpon rosae]
MERQALFGAKFRGQDSAPNRVFPYGEWATSHDSRTSTSSSATISHDQNGGRLKGIRAVPFRRRLQSLPLTVKDTETPKETSVSSENTPAGDDGNKLGGLIGLFRRASVSVKNRHHRRHSHAVPPGEHIHTEGPWNRLKTAASFHRHSRGHSMNHPVDSKDGPSEPDSEHMLGPVPGSGSEPPQFPRNYGGELARTAARAQNKIEQNRQRPSASNSIGDGESGIEITITQSDPCQESVDMVLTSSMVSVDFIAKLPAELAIQIMCLLDKRTLCSIAQVSHCWSKVAETSKVWRDVFLREQTQSYATGKPIPQGEGHGIPAFREDEDWKDLYRIRQELSWNWRNGKCEAFYLNGHLDSIYCVQFDENKIITGSRDKTIRVWDMKTHACTLIIGPAFVLADPALMHASDGTPMHYTQYQDPNHSSRLIQERTSIPDTITYPECHDQSILCLQYDDKILVTGSSDFTTIIHDMKDNFRPIRRLRQHTAAVLDLSFDERYIVTCSKDVSICVWERETGVLLRQLKGHAGPVNAVQLRGDTIVSCSGDFLVKLWNISSFHIIKNLEGHNKGLACSQFSEDSKYIASAGNDRNIRIWNANTYECIHFIKDAHQGLVRSLHIDSISGRLISGSYDSGIKVFDMATGIQTVNFPKWHNSWVLGAKSNYRHLISTGQDPRILIMDFGKSIVGIDKLKSP